MRSGRRPWSPRPNARRAVLRGLALAAALAPALGLPLSGCSEQKNPLGFDSGARGGFQIPPAETLLVVGSDRETRQWIATGSATSILVGQDAEANARGLIRFDTIPDTVGMKYAYLDLYIRRGRGGPDDRINLEIRRVKELSTSWDPTTVKSDSALALSDDLARRDTVATGSAPLTPAFFLSDVKIPFSWIRTWVAHPDSNAGMRISASGGTGIVHIVSRNDAVVAERPALILASDSTTSATRASIGSAASAYVVTALPPVPGPLDSLARVGVAPVSRMLLRFDVSAIPPSVSIVRATLNLTMPAPDLLAKGDALRFYAYEVTDSTAASFTLATVVGGAANQDTTGTTNVFSIDIPGPVQDWVNRKPNEGLILQRADELTKPREDFFRTHEAPSAAIRPTIRVIYLRPPGYRLGSAK